MLVRLFQLLSHLPLRKLHSLGAVLGWLVWLLSPMHRRRLQQNLARAGYAALRNSAIAESGKSILELAYVWCAAPAKVLSTATVDNWALVEQALALQRGVIFLTPHLGCFEIIAQYIATREPLTVLYRPPRKEALKPLMEGARRRPGLTLAPANLTGVRMLLKSLKAGGAIGLLPDQVPQHGEGVWADFFATPAYTMTLPAKLQQMTQAPIILAYAERLAHGRGFAIRFVPGPILVAGAPQEQARQLNLAMQTLIARCPQQYFWSYNRYKCPAGVVPPSSPIGAGAPA